MYIFVDESGDLGFEFKKEGKPSDFFIVGAIKVHDSKCLNRVIKKHRRRLKKKKEQKPEIKFSNTSPANRRRILEDIAKEDVEIFFVYIDKHKAYGYIKDDPVRMYAYLIRILAEKCFTQPITEDTTIFFDRCFPRTQQEALGLYLRTQNRYLLNSRKEIWMKHEPSREHSGLTCTDFVCGALLHKLICRSNIYYDIIKNKVKCEKRLF